MTVAYLSLISQWRHNERDVASKPASRVFAQVFVQAQKEPPKPRFIGLCKGNQLVTGEFLLQRILIAENISLWWRHREFS